MFELVWDFLQADPRQGFECRWSKKEARIEHREEMAGSHQREPGAMVGHWSLSLLEKFWDPGELSHSRVQREGVFCTKSHQSVVEG